MAGQGRSPKVRFGAGPEHVNNTCRNPFWRVAGWFVKTLWFLAFLGVFRLSWGVFWVFFFWHKVLPKTHFWCFQRGWGRWGDGGMGGEAINSKGTVDGLFFPGAFWMVVVMSCHYLGHYGWLVLFHGAL